MLVHDLIKIKFIKEGYLPNFPYSLISDDEMFDAFLSTYYATWLPAKVDSNVLYSIDTLNSTHLDLISYLVNQVSAVSITSSNTLEINWNSQYDIAIKLNDMMIDANSSKCTSLLSNQVQLKLDALSSDSVNTIRLTDKHTSEYVDILVKYSHVTDVKDCFFKDRYPLIDDNLVSQYQNLVDAISYHIQNYRDCIQSSNTYVIPDWVYSYMLGEVISDSSDYLDKHDLLTSLGCDNVEDTFTALASQRCLAVSKAWLSKYTSEEREHRPPTMFGEPHVLKSIRISQI